MSEEALLAEKNKNTFAALDKEDKREAERRRAEWEEVESSAMGGLRKMPEEMKRGKADSIIGGVSRRKGGIFSGAWLIPPVRDDSS